MKRFAVKTMRPVLQFSLAIACLAAAGCSYDIYESAVVYDISGTEFIDPNDSTCMDVEYAGQAGDARMKVMLRYPALYADSEERFAFSHVWGTLQVPVEMPGGKKYRGWLDTGFSDTVLVDQGFVDENDLLRMYIDERPGPFMAGVACIPSMQFGTIRVENLPAFFHRQQWQFRVLGVPVYHESVCLIGLRMIEGFHYVLLDCERKEAEFSYNTFMPEYPDQWEQYPIGILEINGNRRLLVRIPVNGVEYSLMFDTCGGSSSLVLSDPDVVDSILSSVEIVRERRRKSSCLQFGYREVHEFRVDSLEIGPIRAENARVQVLDPSQEFLDWETDMLTLEHFKDTCIVLDFGRDVMWIQEKGG